MLKDIATAQHIITELESEQSCTKRPVSASNFPIALLRKIIHEVLVIFARIISAHLAECTNHDRLLIIALEHLIHLMLFGDEICRVIIQVIKENVFLFFRIKIFIKLFKNKLFKVAVIMGYYNI